MAKSIKTDLFAGIMNEPEPKEIPVAEKNDTKKKVDNTEKSGNKQKTISEKKTNDKPTEKKDTPSAMVYSAEVITQTKEKTSISIDDFLQKTVKPKGGSHTFYLKDTTFQKLEAAANVRGISPSKLLEAMIEMTLD